MDPVFVAYSRRFLISRLNHNVTYNISRSGARSLRVLWYMREMGGGWLTFRDLSLIGAGQYKALQYAIPDLVKDELIDQIDITRKSGRIKNNYKINTSGIKLLVAAENHVGEEYQKAIEKISDFRKKWNIQNQCR